MGFTESSVLSKIGLGLAIVAVIFHIVGFPTPYWLSYSVQNQGLFQICTDSTCLNYSASSDWLDAAKSLTILGCILGLACVIVVTVYVTVKSDIKLLLILGFALAFAAGIFIIIGAAVFSAKSTEGDNPYDNLSWSFALTIVAGILFLIVGVVLLLDKCFNG